MYPAKFEYAAPASLEEAIGLLKDPEAKILAGGHSLLPLMKLRLAAPALLVDLSRVPNLAYIRDGGDHVAIGAMTTYDELESSDLLRQRVPLLSQTAGTVGDMQVRNRGTLGGSIAHADPAGDMPSVTSALGAQIVVQGPDGKRTIAASEFFKDIWTTALQGDEIIAEIQVPYGSGQVAQAYEKFRLRASDWAVVGVAVNLQRDNGSIRSGSVFLTNVGSTPVRAQGVEQALQGQEASRQTIESAAQHASDGLNPTPELRASADYKSHLAQVMTKRALAAALGMQ